MRRCDGCHTVIPFIIIVSSGFSLKIRFDVLNCQFEIVPLRKMIRMPTISMYLAIKEVNPLDNYLLLLTFENGEKRQFDMKPYLDLGIFKELKDLRLFRTVKTNFDSIEWDNQADFDPEVLYQNSIKIV